ncbi:MAG: M1 family metallopeptidase [Polyangiaceae bacterium]|nr:M1 family metallopeptidase [Polyangiaceae bacterium]
MRTALLQIAAGVLMAWLAGRAAAPIASATAPAPVAAPVAASATASATAPGPAAASATAPAPVVLDRPEAVASYSLRATLDPEKHTVVGEGTLRWKNASRVPQRELYVHLYLNGFKSRKSLFLRTPMADFRGDERVSALGGIDVKRFAVREMSGVDVWPAGRPTTPGDPDDETDIRVELPRAVEPGEGITVELAWESRLPSISLRTGHLGRFHMVGQWFPKLARLEPDGRWAHFAFHRLSEFYADFGDYDVTVDVPEGYEVGATGRLEREARAGGRVERRFVQEGVHDFAFAAWDAFRERRETTADGIAIRCLFPPGSERAAELEIASARFGLSFFGDAFGRYPYGTLTIVHPPEGAEEAGGMEYPTLITTGGAWYLPYTGVRFAETVTIHELAHQWFYGLVATDEHRYPFLDEGLTSYAEIEAMRALHGPSSAFGALGLTLDTAALKRAIALLGGQNAPIAQPASAFLSGRDYGALVYSRTAMLLETLSGVYGGGVIRGAIGRYARENRFRHPGPEALLAAVREDAGEGAAEALRAGLFERAWVDYAIDGVEREGGDAGAAHRGYALVRRRGTLVLPVEVELRAADGSSQRVRWDARETAARIPYEGDSPLVGAVIDPEQRVLLDQDLTNNARRFRVERFAPRVLDLASFAAGAALWVVTP